MTQWRKDKTASEYVEHIKVVGSTTADEIAQEFGISVSMASRSLNYLSSLRLLTRSCDENPTYRI